MSSFKKTLEFLGLSYKKEITKILAVNVILISLIPVILILKLQFFVLLVYLVIIAVIEYLLFSLSFSYNKKDSELHSIHLYLMLDSDGFYSYKVQSSFNEASSSILIHSLLLPFNNN